MSVTKKIKIIKIIDETAFIINVGSDDGIERDDKFEILDTEGEQIEDPETGEVLGNLNTSKGIIVAENIYPKMTIAKTRMVGGESTYVRDILKLTNPYLTSKPSHREELFVDESEVTGGLQRSSNPIQIGDEVTKL